MRTKKWQSFCNEKNVISLNRCLFFVCVLSEGKMTLSEKVCFTAPSAIERQKTMFGRLIRAKMKFEFGQSNNVDTECWRSETCPD